MLSNEIKHQTQPTPMGCVCTCLAMLMDEPVQDVIDAYHKAYFDDQSMDVHDILRENGFTFTHEKAGRVQTLLPGTVYLLTVASLNIPGGLHQILVDYREPVMPRVLDPAKGYSNRKYYTFDTAEVDDIKEAFELFSWIVDYTITGRG